MINLEILIIFVIAMMVTVIMVLVFNNQGPYSNFLASVRVRVDNSRRRYIPPPQEEQKTFTGLDIFFWFLVVLLFVLIVGRFV